MNDNNNIFSESILINLNSKDGYKINGTMNSNIIFPVNGLLTDDNSVLYSEVGLISAQIPRSFNTINSINNILDYSLNSIVYQIIITPGNYNANSFITQLNTQFLKNSHTFTITINQSTGLLNFSHSLYNFIFYNTSTILSILGFTSSISSNLNNLLLPYPLNLLGQTTIKIISRQLNCNNYDTESANMLVSIPVNVPNYSIINYENKTNHLNNLKIRWLDYIDILMLDQNNYYLDFQNIDFIITLRLIKYRYKNFPSYSLIDHLHKNNIKHLK
jgi:hypothetical protein